MKNLSQLFVTALGVIFLVSICFAQEFPPTLENNKGPFPTGTEAVRDDAPVDANDPSPSGVIHEYTAYKGTPVVDGDLSDDIWEMIPWTPLEWYIDQVARTEEGDLYDDSFTPTYWDGWEDYTAWFKMVWDEEFIYVATKRIDDDYSFVEGTDLSTGNIWQNDGYQIKLDTRPAFDFETEAPGSEIGFCLVDFEEEAYNYWSNQYNSNLQLELADGNCESTSSSTDGKAIIGTIEETDDGFVEVFEVAFICWPEVFEDEAQMFSICALDRDFDTQEAVLQWAQGIYVKTEEEYGSVVWSSSAPPGGAANELVGHWTFDEMSGTTAADASGKGNDGTIENAAWISGKVGDGALSFDGSTSLVRVPHSASLDIIEQITVAAWINIGSIEGGANVLQKEYFAIGEMRNGDGVLKNVVNIAGTWIVEPYTENAANYIGEWHHIAMTFDGAEMINYFDGEVDGVFPHEGTINASTADLGIGTNSPWMSDWFNGSIDDVRVYNYKLSGAEIQALYVETAVEPNVATTQPSEFELSQNYPNPFNPTTTIEYVVPSKRHVTLKIFNTAGVEIATLVDGEQADGNYHVTFDAANLPSGIYFYRLNMGTIQDSKKMTLIR